MEKVSIDVATAEVESWLDKKKIFQSQRDAQKDSIEVLIEAISEGALRLNQDTFEFTHELLFPLEGEMSLIELKYKPRLNDNMLRPHLNGVKTSDGDGRLLALVAALTNKPKAMLSALDSSDKRISMAIAVFFL